MRKERSPEDYFLQSSDIHCHSDMDYVKVTSQYLKYFYNLLKMKGCGQNKSIYKRAGKEYRMVLSEEERNDREIFI